MPPKSKSSKSLPTTLEACPFENIELSVYCAKKLYQVCFICEENQTSGQVLNSIVKHVTNQDFAHVMFITFEEVIDLARTSLTSMHLLFPPKIVSILLKISKDAVEYLDKGIPLPLDILAAMTKLKIIDVMNRQYAAAVSRMRRSKVFDEEISEIVKGKPPKPGKLSSPKGKVKKATSQPTFVNEDFTAIPLDEPETPTDDEIHKQMYNYLLKGFKDPGIIRELIKVHVPVAAVIKFNEKLDLTSDDILFWNTLETFSESDESGYLKNTIFMRFVPNYDEIKEGDDYVTISNTILLQMSVMLTSILDLKRHHIKYINHLKITEIEDHKPDIKMFNFAAYESTLNQLPMECVTIPLIISTILDQISGSTESLEALTDANKLLKKSTHIDTTCPFKLRSYLNAKKSAKINEPGKKKERTFRIYEDDPLELSVKSYKHVGSIYCDLSISVLKQLDSMQLVKGFKPKAINIPHTHDAAAPLDRIPQFSDDEIDQFINLYYLDNIRCHSKPPFSYESNDFNKYLDTYSEYNTWKQSLPKSSRMGNKLCVGFTELPSDQLDFNMYERFNSLKYNWAEYLTSSLLLQNLFECEEEYICKDCICCNATESVIFKFHNAIDSFGCNIRIWSQSLRTPVCLRDFCKYIINQDAKWLENNKPKKQIKYLETRHYERAVEIETIFNNEIYRPYKHLLAITPNTTPLCLYDEDHIPLQVQNEPKLSANISEIMKEILLYPESNRLLEQCNKSEEKACFSAYDFGTDMLRLVGLTYDFFSHDSVRITIDTSRFSFENFRISTTITSENNSVIIRSNEPYFMFHTNLSNGTIIAIYKSNKPEKSKKTSLSEIFDDISSASQSMSPQETPQSPPKEASQHSVIDHPTKITVNKVAAAPTRSSTSMASEEEEKLITSIDFEEFRRMNMVYPKYEDHVTTLRDLRPKVTTQVEVECLKKLGVASSCYKVSDKKISHFKYLTKKLKTRMIPISSVVKRVLASNIKKSKYRQFRKKCVTTETREEYNNNVYDFNISLPSGLLVKSLNSPIHRNYMAVKQSYISSLGYEAIEIEEYRLYFVTGELLVKKRNGTINIYSCTGDIVIFRKPRVDEEGPFAFEGTTREPKDLDTFRKQLQRIMDVNYYDEMSDGFDHFISRRGHLHSRMQSIPREVSNSVLSFKFPYSEISIIKANGYKTTLRHNKVIRTLHSRVYKEKDFQTDEELSVRNDGFRELYNSVGAHFVQFPDGTIINSTFQTEEELIFIDKHDSEGWVSVVMNFEFQHPYYLKVEFDNGNKTIGIYFDDNNQMEISQKECTLSLEKGITISANKTNIKFKKVCPECETGLECNVNIKNLYKGVPFKKHDEFLYAEDSYKKILITKYDGSCERNVDFLNGKFNKVNCNHYEKRMYHKVFIVDKNMKGKLMWTNQMIDNIQMNSQSDIMIEPFIKKDLVSHMKFTKNNYKNFSKRFINESLLNHTLELSSAPNKPQMDETYKTVRYVYNMMENYKLNFLIRGLYKSLPSGDNLVVNLDDYLLHTSASFKDTASVTSSVLRALPKPCPSMLQIKLDEWRKRVSEAKELLKDPVIPPYFHSNVQTLY